MNLREAAMAGALTVAAGAMSVGCAPEFSVEVAPATTTTQLPPLENYMGSRDYADPVRDGQVDVHVMVQPIVGAEFDTTYDRMQAYRDVVGSENGVLAQEVADGLFEATEGRVEAQVTTELMQPIEIERPCIGSETRDDAVVARFEAIAAENTTPNQMPVIIAELPGCIQGEDELTGSTLEGYTSFPVDSTPMVVVSSDGSDTGTMGHELGHGWGLDHAGELACESSITIDLCDIDAVGGTSIMGYGDRRWTQWELGDRFSTPELSQLGLLRSSEQYVIDDVGQYELGSLANWTDPETPKLLSYTTSDGQEILLSLERDETAGQEVACQPDPGEYVPNQLAFGTDEDGNNFVCVENSPPNIGSSVRVRQRTDGGNVISDVLPQTSGLDELIPESLFPVGYFRPGDILYTDADRTITIAEFNPFTLRAVIEVIQTR